MGKPIAKLRLGVSPLTFNVYVGRVNKAGDAFLDGKQDVTSDFLKAVVDRFLDGESDTLRSSSGELWKVTLKKVCNGEDREGEHES